MRAEPAAAPFEHTRMSGQSETTVQRPATEPGRTLGDTEAGYARPITLLPPRRIVQPLAWIGHIPFAFWLVDVLRPRRFVELGTHSGNSFCAFLQAAAETGSAGDYFAVDHWRGDAHAGHYDDAVFDDLKRHVDANYGHRATLMRMTFDEALPHFDDRTIDLLHIDGLHTYEAVRHDFQAWLPKMSERGIVLLHDTAVRERDFGVHRLLAELGDRYPTFAFLHSHGLGIVRAGAAPLPRPLSALLRGEADPHGLDPRAYFGRLGDALVDKHYLALLSQQIEHRENAELAVTDVHRLRATLKSYRTQMAESDVALSPAAVILSTDLFDPIAYRARAGLPEMDGLSLARHYLEQGESAGVPPSHAFDPQFYREAYPDVAAQGLNMLWHYICYGRSEGRLPHAPQAGNP